MVPNPVKPVAGLNVSPLSAVLMLVSVPEKVTTGSSVPSPVLNVRPVTPDNDTVPDVATSVTLSASLPASTSETEIALKVAVEKTSGVSGKVVCCTNGNILTGGSLTAFTVIVNVCSAEVSCPPLAVPPLSFSTTVIVAVPLALNAGL